jgi:hypothetical protein
MSRDSKVFLVVAVLIVGIGAFLDSGSIRAAPQCDNRCRKRDAFFYCNTGPCVKFFQTDCLLCSATPNVRCLDNGDYNSGLPNCVDAVDYPLNNIVVYYDDCNPSCTCPWVAVEALITGAEQVESYGVTRKVCAGTPS